MIVAWWSGGATSAVACKLALDKYVDIKVVYIETGSHHPDILRFKKDCEGWYGVDIETIQHHKWVNHFEVCEALRFINSARGAACTTQLKRRVREKWEKGKDITHYVWGFEKGSKEENRASRLLVSMPGFGHIFPLIEAGVNKIRALQILTSVGIRVPEMYRLGYPNNNCIGCPKGGKAYWNKIRVDFPSVFSRMSALERAIGRSCIKDTFLDELDPKAGRGTPPLVEFCGATGEGCEIQESVLNTQQEE